MDDLISRQAAIAEFSSCELTPDGGIDANYAIDFLEQMPSAQPVEDIHREKEQAYYCGYEDGAKAARSAQPGWIPCKTALPKTEEKVWVTCEHLDIYGKPHRYVCKAYHVDRYTVRADFDYWDEGCDEYREEDDQYYVLEGWYEYIHNWGDYSSVRITEDKVLAWCPLPEPWKGEEHGTSRAVLSQKPVR